MLCRGTVQDWLVWKSSYDLRKHEPATICRGNVVALKSRTNEMKVQKKGVSSFSRRSSSTVVGKLQHFGRGWISEFKVCAVHSDPCVTVRMLVCGTWPLRLKLLPKIRKNVVGACLYALSTHKSVKWCSDVATGKARWLCLIYWRGFCTTYVFSRSEEAADTWIRWNNGFNTSRVTKLSSTSSQGLDSNLFVPIFYISECRHMNEDSIGGHQHWCSNVVALFF